MNPVAAFEKWFNDLSPEHQHDLATLVLFCLPDVPVVTLTADSFDAAQAFRQWLATSLSVPTLPMKTAGKALIDRALVDTFVMVNKGSSDEDTLGHWAAAARAEGEPGFAKALERAVVEEPFRSRKWQRSRTSWDALCAGPLSDSALHAWSVGRGRVSQ